MLNQHRGFADWITTEFPQVKPLAPPVASGAPEAARPLFDEPFADCDYPAHQQQLADRSNGITVALSDTGADVLFGQAQRYRSVSGGRAQRSRAWLPRIAGGGAGSRTADETLDAYSTARGGLAPAARRDVRKAWALPDNYDDYWLYRNHYRGNLPALARLQFMELATYVPDALLTQLDRQAMRMGVEARAALLDQDLLEWVLAAPDRLRTPRFDLAGALCPDATAQQRPPLFRRLGNRLRSGWRSDDQPLAPVDTLALLRRQFPELALPD